MLSVSKTSSMFIQDVHRIGGIPAVMKYLLKLGWLFGECMTVCSSGGSEKGSTQKIGETQKIGDILDGF